MAKRFLSQADAVEMAKTYFPSFLRSRSQAIKLDKWLTGRQYDLHNEGGDGSVAVEPDEIEYGRPFAPRAEDRTEEYVNLQTLSPNNFAGLVTASLAQTAYIEGLRRPGVKDTLPVWETFKRNRWLARQSSIHRATIGTGVSYGAVMPGTDPLTGSKMSKMLTRSSKVMSAFYQNDEDEWPVVAIEAHPWYEETGLGAIMQIGWRVSLWDEYVVHRLTVKGDGANRFGLGTPDGEPWTYIDHVEHGLPVVPVARCVNRIDLDGRTTGEIEPILPMLRRVDQDLFDRLIVQRFGAWQVRYIAGMAKPSSASAEAAQALKLRIEDMLISTDHETKFGVLPAGPLSPHIEATDHDLRLLAAISQTPPHHLLGLSSNLQAEALAAAESGLQRKGFDFRTNAGMFHEQMARLASLAEGDVATANAYDMQVRWKDTESRSLTQAADALGKLAVQLKVPVEMLWERIPGWTDDDVVRAKDLVESGSLDQLIAALEQQAAQQATQQPPTDQNQPGSTGGNGN
jgi:hypothetical protein